MAIRDILTIPNPTLYKVSEPVTQFNKKVRPLVRDMFETMYEASGVGLAAVQIGVLQRVLIIDLASQGFTKGTYINPHVIEKSDELQRSEEGCLSVPGLSVDIDRPMWVKVGYQDISGQAQSIECEALMARALLHEMDHLDGKVFVDLIEPEFKINYKETIKQIERGEWPSGAKTPGYRVKNN